MRNEKMVNIVVPTIQSDGVVLNWFVTVFKQYSVSAMAVLFVGLGSVTTMVSVTSVYDTIEVTLRNGILVLIVVAFLLLMLKLMSRR